MNDRERLIELIMSANCVSGFAGSLADYLKANGVTIQKHGRWTHSNVDWKKQKAIAECANCNAVYELPIFILNSFKYCPNCGAKMELEEGK